MSHTPHTPRKWQVFAGSQGWYIAIGDATGWHSQPADWAASAWYPTWADAEEACQLAEREEREADEAEAERWAEYRAEQDLIDQVTDHPDDDRYDHPEEDES